MATQRLNRYFWKQKEDMRKYLMLLMFSVGFAQPQGLSELYASSVKSYRHGMYAEFLFYAKKVDSLRPSHPVYTRNLASAYALNNKPAEAITLLRKIILMDGTSDYDTDKDFESLYGLPEYQQLALLKKSLLAPVIQSEKVVALNEKDLHPEGLVYLEKKKVWLAGSIRKGKVVSFDAKTGKCEDWLDTEFPVFAMKADDKQQYLWVATSAIREMEGFKADFFGKGEILKVNIKKRTIEERFSIGGKHLFGDLVVGKNGVVYVSDSENPVIYKIESGSLIPFLRVSDRLCNFQGLTFNDDHSKLYLADYFNGIAEIPVAAPESIRWLAFPEGSITKGIDGLAWYDNSLVAIHNGVKPIRIIRYFLNAAGHISSYKVIDNNRPEFAEPTLGVVVKDSFYFFGNCPWPAYDNKHQLDPAKLQHTELYTFRLRD